MSKRMIVALATVAAATAATPVGLAAPAEAQATVSWVSVAGNFTGDARAELFIYDPGTATDALLSFSLDGQGTALIESFPFTMDGTGYVPLAGDFDGDNRDEIFWYGPGSAPDSMWHFQSTSSVVSVNYSVSGNYKPIVGDFTGDGADDIFWYAPGTAGDPLWDFNGGGAYTSAGRTVNGTYKPVAASVGKDATDDIVWYAPGTAPDSMWDFTKGTTSYTTKALSVNGTSYRPIVIDAFDDGWRGEDILWYLPGASQHPVWDFLAGTNYPTVLNESIPLYDNVTVGDYFGDGIVDITWDRADSFVLWDFVGDGGFFIYEWFLGEPVSASGQGRPATSLGTSTDAPVGQREQIDRNL